MRTRPTTTGWLALAASALFAAALGAQTMKHLPDGLEVPKSADSPGKVVFNHSTHVDEATPDCTTCHPKPFRILKADKAARTPIVHERMAKGEQCGKCHDGKKAFALEDDCTRCHQPE